MREMMEERVEAWKAASELVEPIVEQHGITEYKNGAVPFGPMSTFTKVDQHLDQIMRIANWLIGVE